MFEYKFPDIGEGITEGTLTKWLVKVGDQVTEGQDLAEIETDKMTTNLPSAATGTVHELLVPEYGTLEVGKVFITIDDGKGPAEPALKESVTEQKTPTGMKQEGDTKKQDEEPIKAGPKDMDEPSTEKVDEEAGVVGALISSQDELPPSDEGKAPAKETSEKKKVLATPVARKMAKDLDVDIQKISGTGPGGRVMKEDIQKFAEESKARTKPVETIEKPAGQSTPVMSSDEEIREPLTRIRKTIVQRMTESKQNLVHTTTIEEIDVSTLVAFREKMKAVVGEDVKLTYLPFILKAIVLGLKEFPVFNSTLDEENQEIVYKKNYNIGIATDTERGLVVPVLFGVDHKSILELAKGIEELAELARENKLTLEHLRGGTFSITNYGAIGGAFGTPIINYPESAILGIGRIQQKPIVRDGQIVVGHILPLSLSFDHRIIDGASGIRFMRFIADALTDPELLLLRS